MLCMQVLQSTSLPMFSHSSTGGGNALRKEAVFTNTGTEKEGFYLANLDANNTGLKIIFANIYQEENAL